MNNHTSCCGGENKPVPETAVDPVCEMTVYPDTARFRLVWQRQSYYFCCSACRDVFAANPAGFAHGKEKDCLPDPVCGMKVPVSAEAHHLSYKGVRYYFCCAGCRRKFNLAPDRCLDGSFIISKSAAKVASRSSRYTCPMHPAVQSDTPGDCPQCGMPLEPATPEPELDNKEVEEVAKCLRVSALFTVPLALLSMSHMFGPGAAANHWVLVSWWLQFALATPVVLWAARPFLRRG